MQVLIVGTGGVGGYFGGRMAKAGHDVTFIARGDHKKAMEENGLEVKSINGDFSLKKVKVTDSIADAATPDLVIISVKAWQVKDIAVQLKKVIDGHTMVLPLQNGVLASDELKEELSEKNVLAGLCRIISKIDGPGKIHHMAVDPVIVFGECNNSKSDRVLELEKTFNDSGFKGQVPKDIQAALWKKFISICTSGWLAVTRATHGEVREQKETRSILKEILNEGTLLARKKGINITEDYPDKMMAFIDTFPYDSTTSLTRDIWDGKPSELEYQNGTIVKLADEIGLDVPVNRFIYYSLILMEKRARGNS
ncbi:ketopantoate reductase family protein [Marinilabilia rubra]|uniref:2-dehydropantoate 2-reductase n=1 Tax=Marinilabilia rubra TaxID=2162893 RepID=A0A2U2BCS2_9BACT|nr:2-dehydropantoate 2-reductase [Marinilabilia rubra]PWE00860.1 2-dehydropantoate 2-reductase [Marinilabilia rubra]